MGDRIYTISVWENGCKVERSFRGDQFYGFLSECGLVAVKSANIMLDGKLEQKEKKAAQRDRLKVID